MNKQALIDKAVEDLKGVLPEDGMYLLFCKQRVEEYKAGQYAAGNSACPHESYWDVICTTEKFTQRARELGWINSYKWGVEYQTNGKKPDLDDDVVVWYENPVSGFNSEFKCYGINWRHISRFRIVDERYKPKEPEQQTKHIKDLSGVIFAVSDAISVAVDAGAMPAARELQKINRDLLAKDSVVGIGRPELQAKPKMSKERPNNFPFIGCLVEHINWGVPIKIKFLGERFFIAEKTDASIGEDKEVCGFIGDLHPIKNERERFVETALNAADKFIAFAQALYDAGFKAPDEKSRS